MGSGSSTGAAASSTGRLTQFGLDYTNHNWLEQPLSFYFVATVIVVWMSVPFVAFSVYAGLTQISAR